MTEKQAWEFIADVFQDRNMAGVSLSGQEYWISGGASEASSVISICQALLHLHYRFGLDREIVIDMRRKCREFLMGKAFIAPRTQEGAAIRREFCLQQASRL